MKENKQRGEEGPEAGSWRFHNLKRRITSGSSTVTQKVISAGTGITRLLSLPSPPSSLFNSSLPKLSQVVEVVRKTRAASVPGHNMLPYKLYKYCQGVLKHLWNLLSVAWKNQVISSQWQRAVTVLTPLLSASSGGSSHTCRREDFFFLFSFIQFINLVCAS